MPPLTVSYTEGKREREREKHKYKLKLFWAKIMHAITYVIRNVGNILVNHKPSSTSGAGGRAVVGCAIFTPAINCSHFFLGYIIMLTLRRCEI